MVRMSKVVEEDQEKVTFAQAIKNKYVDQQEVDDKVVLPSDNKISTKITFVGFGKLLTIQKQLIKLVNIDLSNKKISAAGGFDKFDGGLDRVRILNLADNFLTWHHVAIIIKYTPRLTELILTNNPLFDGKNLDEDVNPQRSLASLTIGHIYKDWNSIIQQLSTIFESVEKLDLWSNQLNDEKMSLISTDYDDFIRKIKSLKLGHNYFKSVDWLKSAGPLCNLVELDLSSCGIQSFELDRTSIQLLKNLTDLNISYNEIDNWKSISVIYHLKNLRHLICHENPLYITERDSKPMTIGLLGSITTINREEITKVLRTDSELYYIRKVFPQYQLHENGSSNDFPDNHPRYEELIRAYGIPEDLLKKPESDKYVTVDLCFDVKRITKKLPRDMKVTNVELLCKKLFNLRPSTNLTLICLDIHSGLSYELERKNRSLHFFSVENGQELHVEQNK